MSESEFLQRLGFESNPFQYTDADLEDRLPDYFVPPPYFPTVFGDPKNPSSVIVFAPRGSGKSAQRRMVEIECPPDTLLCITYDTYSWLLDEHHPENVTLSDHLRMIVRLTLIGLLTHIENTGEGASSLPDNERKIIQLLAMYYLDPLGQQEFRESLNALKNFPERAKQFWEENFWLVNSVGSFILKKIGIPLEQPKLSAAFGDSLDPSPTLHMHLLGGLAAHLGFDSVYILVDKVDETAATSNNPEAAYRLIAALIQDLKTISLAPYAFKFFLPDTLESFHQQYGRPDRIPQKTLRWKPEDLKQILSRRLAAHSGGTVTTEYAIIDVESWPAQTGTATAEDTMRAVMENWIYRFAHGSPRDLIRIWQHILAEQLRINPNAERIEFDAIVDGLDAFCAARTKEVLPQRIFAELQRAGRLDFTTNYIANDVFKIESNSARNKIKAWTDTGAVMRQADKQMRGARRPVYHYAVEDLRVARSLMSDLNAYEFWLKKVVWCSSCHATLIRDWDRESVHVCRQCGSPVAYDPSDDIPSVAAD